MTLIDRRIQSQRQRHAELGRLAIASLVSVLGVVALALEHGFRHHSLPAELLGALQVALPWFAMVIAGDVRWRSVSRGRWRGFADAAGEALVAIALASLLLGSEVIPACIAVLAMVVFAIRFQGVIARSLRNAALLFPASFLVLIAGSASLLMLPIATPPDRTIGWVDATFTATSAVCVTGLTVRDTATGFTQFGQGVILASIQIGGLGVMIFGSTLALLFGARLSVKETATLSVALDEYPGQQMARFVYFIVLTTLLLEAIGAAVLFFTWPESAGPLGSRLWQAVFHSVSAFCNAGFDVTGQSMIGVRSDAAPYLGLIPMIVLGGLGFLVLEDVYRQIRGRLRGSRRRLRLSTHSKVVLATTALLLFGGFVVIFVAQTVEEGTVSGQTALDAAFMSTSARTAGFTSVPMEELTPGSRFSLMALMSIGGSPGSTAGGMKTAVFAMLVLAVYSTVRGRREVEAFGRALPDSIVKKAATVVVGLFGVIALATFTLDMTEEISFEPLLFEVTSAATTTGLSLGATDMLSDTGRIIITLTMYLGRVGALAVLAGLIGSGDGTRYQLPRDSVSLG